MADMEAFLTRITTKDLLTMKNRMFWIGLYALVWVGLQTGSVWGQTQIAADFDSNGKVDFSDFSQLIAGFGKSTADSTFNAAVDLNGDGAIDGEDAFLFADVFASNFSLNQVTEVIGPNTETKLKLEPTRNGFLLVLEGAVRLGGYRVVLTLADTVSIVQVEDLLNMGMLPVRETPSGVEIVGLILGTEALADARVLAAVTVSGDTSKGTVDTAGVVVKDVVLRGERASLGSDQFRVERNTLAADNISRIPNGDVSLSDQFFDLGDVRLGDTITRVIRITNTFDKQRVFGSRRPLTFAVDLSDSQLTAKPRVFGVLSDTTSGLTSGNTENIEVTYSPTQPGPFSGTVTIRTNRSERDTILVGIRARAQFGIGNEVKAFADFDSSGSVDFLDFQGLFSRYATTPDSAKFDLDGDGIIDPKDLFLFADLLGKSVSSRGYDSITVISGQNQGAAVRAEISGNDITISVRGLRKLGGYRIGFKFDPEEVAIDGFKDLSQGGGLPIRTLSTGAVVAGLAFGEHVAIGADLGLARVTFRALKGQENVTSLVTLNGVTFRGSRGERDSLEIVLIGSLGLDVNPRKLDFGNVRLGGESQKTFTIFNLGSNTVSFLIASSDTLVTTKPRSVGNFGSGRTWEVTATYRSVEPGPFASTLTVSTEDTSAVPIQIPVVAFGAVPSISRDTLNFGEVFLGRDSTLSVEVTNPNLTPFEIQDLVFSGTDTSFTLDPLPDLPLEVEGGGGKQVLEVKYRPLARGTLLDTLRIVGADTTFVVALLGRGIESGAAISATNLAFGNVIAGQDTTLLLIISNTGNIPYILDSLVQVSTDTVFADSVTIDSIFTVVSSPSFPDTLASGATDTISIRLSPDTTGVVTDTLRIFSVDTTFVVTMSGNGLPKPVDVGTDLVTVVFSGTIQLNRDLIHFGAVPYGERDSVVFRVENRRGTSLTYRFSATDSQVTVRPDSVQNLPPNQSWDVVVVLAPVDSVQTLSQVHITTDDPADGVTVIRFKSGGSFPSFSDSTLSFGNVGLGLSLTKNVTVTNQGRSNMVVNQLGFVGSDSVFVLASPPNLPFAIAAEGGSQVFSVRFNPSSRGTFTDTLRIVSLDTTVFLPVVGVGRESVVEVVPDSLGFGLVRLGDSITLDLSIENTGNDTVQVLDLTVVSGDSTFSVVSLPTLPDTLLPQGGKRTLGIQFTPQFSQPFQDTLRVVIGFDTVQVQLTGTGTVASAILSASDLDFGSPAVGKVIRKTLTLTNQGNVPFQIISGDLIQGNLRFSLAGSPTFPDTVGVNEVLNLVIEFKPDTTGTQIDTLRLVGQDTTLTVALKGVGEPSLILTYRDDGVTQSGPALDFGNVKAGGTDLRILRISNQKSSALSFSVAGAEGENIVIRPSSLTNLPAGDHWDLQVTWDPTEASELWTFVQVTADAVETVSLARGEVFARVNPDSLAYGNVRVGQDSIQTVSIKNNGLSDLVIQAVGLGDETGFSLVSSLTLPDTLFTGDSLRVRVRFTSADSVLARDTLRITARDTAFAVPLSAQGIQESVSLSTDQLAFGDVAVGADSSLTVRITNIGNGSVVLDSLKLVGTDTAFVLTATPLLPKVLAANGGADSVVVRFRPSDLASFTNILRFYAGARIWETVLTGNSTKTLAVSSGIQLTFGLTVSLSDSTLNFGDIPTGSSRSLSFSISNGRDSSLSISVESTNAQVMVTPQSVSGLLNNQSVDVVVTFTPVSLGETSVLLNITTNVPADSTVQIQVQKAPNPLQVTPGVLDFESIAVGEQRDLDVTVINPKGLNFRIQNLILVHAAFSLVTPPALPDTVAPNGGTRILKVQFAPQQGGIVRDTLNIVGADTTLRVALSGIGIQSQAAATPAALDFGEVTLDADSSQTVTVANSGAAVLLLQSLVFVTGDSVFGLGEVPTLPDSVANGESVTFTVTFSPADSGSVLDTLVISARDTIIRVPLSGFGKPPVVVEPELTPDFDGDGTVGFSDFILFSGQFGAKAGEPGFDPKFDLDSDGEVGFSDFLTFSAAFGTTIGKPTVLAKPTSE